MEIKITDITNMTDADLEALVANRRMEERIEKLAGRGELVAFVKAYNNCTVNGMVLDKNARMLVAVEIECSPYVLDGPAGLKAHGFTVTAFEDLGERPARVRATVALTK